MFQFSLSEKRKKKKKATPSLIDVKGLGRPTEFTGREEDFEHGRRRRRHSLRSDQGGRDDVGGRRTIFLLIHSSCSKKKSSEHVTEITTESWILNSCRLRRKSSEVRKHTALVARTMRQMTLAPIHGRTRWRHGRGCRKDMIRRQEEESGISFARTMGILRVAVEEKVEGHIRCVKTTPQRTRFRDVKHARIWYTV